MQDYRKLNVWQKAHQLTLETYAFSARLTAPATWPLRNQLLRAVISVPSNIAEGAGRGSDADFNRFLVHALGSLNEVEYDFLLARDLGMMGAADHARLSRQVAEVRRMLSGLMSGLKPPPAEKCQLRAGPNHQLEAGSWKPAAD
jgi:four helix bundle protein